MTRMDGVPLQNRVDPMGNLIATPERGAWTGNRGVLLDREGKLARTWRLRRWLICRLDYKGMWRPVWTPGRWTELFFLDEATALAAGHRPCAYCRREDSLRFRRAWEAGNGAVGSLVELDDLLHAARQRRYVASLGELPDGAMVLVGDQPHLWRGGRAWRWTFGGYGGAVPVGPRETVTVLTPEPVVRALREGYECQMGLTGG
jgi:hypothetical protein